MSWLGLGLFDIITYDVFILHPSSSWGGGRAGGGRGRGGRAVKIFESLLY